MRPEDEEDLGFYNGYLFQNLFQNRHHREQENYLSQPATAAYVPYPQYYRLGINNHGGQLPYGITQAPRSSSPLPGNSELTTIGTQESSAEKSKRCSWANTEVRSLIAAYKENYERLKTTRSSHGKKSVWDGILADFLSLSSDAGIDSDKTLAQIKEKWRSLFDKYKAVKDNNNKTGRDRKSFEFFDDIDDFLSGSDKVNPKFVKETRVQTKAAKSSPESRDIDFDITGEESNTDPTTEAKAEEKGIDGAKKTPNHSNEACPKKRKRKRTSIENSEADSTILNLMEAQQEAIEKADQKDERMFEALLKSQEDSQQRHQEFTLSVLGKLGEIFSAKK